MRIKIADYPELSALAWNRAGATITPEEALGLYRANWRFVSEERMPEHERALLRRLIDEYGGGVFSPQPGAIPR